MADPNKFNDLSESGNVYGPLMKNVDSNTNNGRTPVNPVAQNPMSFKIETIEPKSSTKGYSGPPAA